MAILEFSVKNHKEIYLIFLSLIVILPKQLFFNFKWILGQIKKLIKEKQLKSGEGKINSQPKESLAAHVHQESQEIANTEQTITKAKNITKKNCKLAKESTIKTDELPSSKNSVMSLRNIEDVEPIITISNIDQYGELSHSVNLSYVCVSEFLIGASYERTKSIFWD